MTVHDLRKKLKALPDEAQVPVGWIRQHLGEAEDLEWCGVKEAARATGLSAAKLRRRALVWGNQTKPEVRVRKRNADVEGSMWLFCVEDCWRYRRTHADPPPEDGDIIAHYARKAVVNL